MFSQPSIVYSLFLRLLQRLHKFKDRQCIGEKRAVCHCHDVISHRGHRAELGLVRFTVAAQSLFSYSPFNILRSDGISYPRCTLNIDKLDCLLVVLRPVRGVACCFILSIRLLPRTVSSDQMLKIASLLPATMRHCQVIKADTVANKYHSLPSIDA